MQTVHLPDLRGMREMFLMLYVLREAVPMQVGLKYMQPSQSSSTSGDSAEPYNCKVCGERKDTQ